MTKNPKRRSYKRLVLGDVIEIHLSNGRLAYAQFAYYYRDPPVWGHLIRVLPGIYEKRPDLFNGLVKKKEVFSTFFFAAPAISSGQATIVANEEIPETNRALPLFKSCNQNYETGVKDWWLWDGKKSRRIGRLSLEHFDLPMKQLVPINVLIERIESGWTPRDEVADASPAATSVTRDRD